MDSTLIAQLLGQMDKSTQESPYSTKGMAYKVLNQMVVTMMGENNGTTPS